LAIIENEEFLKRIIRCPEGRARAAGRLKGHEKLAGKIVLTVGGVSLSHEISTRSSWGSSTLVMAGLDPAIHVFPATIRYIFSSVPRESKVESLVCQPMGPEPGERV
jgi:hypothetical protein